MAKEAYIEIDGKRTQLTVEQMKALGIYEEPKANANPFKRVEIRKKYYNISTAGDVVSTYEANDNYDNGRYKAANYCTDKELMQQRALHETLNRLLWKFSMENEGDKIDWENGKFDKWYICYENRTEIMRTSDNCHQKNEGTIYFHTMQIAKRAINEIILPFMKEHPDFIW